MRSQAGLFSMMARSPPSSKSKADTSMQNHRQLDETSCNARPTIHLVNSTVGATSLSVGYTLDISVARPFVSTSAMFVCEVEPIASSPGSLKCV